MILRRLISLGTIASLVLSGYALAPATEPSMFTALRVEERLLSHQIADIRDLGALRAAILQVQPDIVIHMAAQPIVSVGYEDPVATFETNVMGTVNVLEACRGLDNACGVVVVSSDKCYANDDSGRRFQETDPLGGKDPYSASKAGTEIVCESYIHAFFSGDDQPIRLATARAGNVIGGGDWSPNRLLADAARCFSTGQSLVLRNPNSTRPWQHVAEACLGYVMLCENLMTAEGRRFARPWNFGPHESASVLEVAQLAANSWGGAAAIEFDTQAGTMKEHRSLEIDASAAIRHLGWHPSVGIAERVKFTMDWYKRFYDEPDPRALAELTLKQVRALG